MKPVLYAMLLSAVAYAQAMAQDSPIFPQGEKSPPDHHTGTVWIKELNGPDSIFNYSIAVATFDPGAVYLRGEWKLGSSSFTRLLAP